MLYLFLFPGLLVALILLAKAVSRLLASGSTDEQSQHRETKPVTTSGLKFRCRENDISAKLDQIEVVVGSPSGKEKKRLLSLLENSTVFCPHRKVFKMSKQPRGLIVCWTRLPEDFFELRIETEKEIILTLKESLGVTSEQE